jgi:hypothetical protein
MGLEGLIWIVPAYTAIAVACLGGFFVMLGWVRFASDARALPGRKASLALLAFSASVLTDIAVCGVLWMLRDSFLLDREILDTDLRRLTLSSGLILSFLLLLVSTYYLRRDSSAARIVVKTGSLVLLVANVLGLTLFFLARYSM